MNTLTKKIAVTVSDLVLKQYLQTLQWTCSFSTSKIGLGHVLFFALADLLQDLVSQNATSQRA